jgi:hypothetical protein
LHGEALCSAAGCDRESGLDLIEDENDPASPGELADRLEVARLGRDDPEVHHRGLHDHAGRRAALGLQPLDAPLHRAHVVERHRHGELDDRLRQAGAVADRRELVRGNPGDVDAAGRDHDRVVVAVVGAEDLDDRVAAGQRAGDADRVHRCLGAEFV